MDISKIKTAVLRAFISDKQGKPEKSHNRPMLERKAVKLGFTGVEGVATARESQAPTDGEHMPPLAPKERARAIAKRPHKAKPAAKAKAPRAEKRSKPKAAKRTKPATNGEHKFRTHDGPTPVFDVPTKSGEHKTTAPDATVAEVKRLRKAGTSLRGMCAALVAGKFTTARGGTSWSPSSVQSIMRAL